MTVFNDTDKVLVYDPRTRKSGIHQCWANTVIIDRRLIEDLKQEHRLALPRVMKEDTVSFHPQVFSVTRINCPSWSL